jgi:hypothetical protein
MKNLGSPVGGVMGRGGRVGERRRGGEMRREERRVCRGGEERRRGDGGGEDEDEGEYGGEEEKVAGCMDGACERTLRYTSYWCYKDTFLDKLQHISYCNYNR